MATKNYVSNDFWSAFVDSMNVFDCRLSGVNKNYDELPSMQWERSGSVVECLTRDREAAGSSLTGVIALWSLTKKHLS